MPRDPVAVATVASIPTSRIYDMLICAFEGGSNYWCRFGKAYHYKRVEEFCEGKLDHLNLVEDCGEGDDPVYHRLTWAKIQAGLQLLTSFRQWKDLVEENDDAETGDVFLQLCLFGKLVYG